MPHLMQLKHDYNILENKYNCVVQESFVVQDPPAPPSDTLLLPPLTSLHSALARNQELPQPGESRPVLPPTQRTLSRQIMKKWLPWTTILGSSSNARMLEQLTLCTPLTIDATKAQDLNPGPCSNIDYPSVLSHEMMVIESGEQPSRKLTWKPTVWISDIISLVLLNSRCPYPSITRKSASVCLSAFRRFWGSFADLQTPICSASYARVVCLQVQLNASLCWSPGQDSQGHTGSGQ